MKAFLLIAIFFIPSIFVSTGASAQNVYRCGNTYSEKPCPDAVAVDVQDGRSAAQRQQSQAALRRDSATVRTAERERAKENAHHLAKKDPPPARAKKNEDPKPAASNKNSLDPMRALTEPKPNEGQIKKKKEPEFFTAHAIVPKPTTKASASK